MNFKCGGVCGFTRKVSHDPGMGGPKIKFLGSVYYFLGFLSPQIFHGFLNMFLGTFYVFPFHFVTHPTVYK